MSVRESCKFANSGITLIILTLKMIFRFSSLEIKFASFIKGSNYPSFFSKAENSAYLFLIAASSRLILSILCASSWADLSFCY
jgi:hypothetical protein